MQTLEQRVTELQAICDQYKDIPDARQYVSDLHSKAEQEYDAILATARQKATQLERASDLALANLDRKLSLLLKDAADGFESYARTAAVAEKERTAKAEKKAPSLRKSSPDPVQIKRITPSAFKRIAPKGYVALDFETTGLSPYADRIIEIGAIQVLDGEIVKSYSTLVNPNMSISPEATQVNHITNSMVQDAPSEEKVLPSLLEFIGDRPVVAHNANFDMAFLEKACQRHKLPASISYADSLEMSRKAFPNMPNYKLTTVADELYIRYSAEHRADTDCKILASVVERILHAD